MPRCVAGGAECWRNKDYLHGLILNQDLTLLGAFADVNTHTLPNTMQATLDGIMSGGSAPSSLADQLRDTTAGFAMPASMDGVLAQLSSAKSALSPASIPDPAPYIAYPWANPATDWNAMQGGCAGGEVGLAVMEARRAGRRGPCFEQQPMRGIVVHAQAAWAWPSPSPGDKDQIADCQLAPASMPAAASLQGALNGIQNCIAAETAAAGACTAGGPASAYAAVLAGAGTARGGLNTALQPADDLKTNAPTIFTQVRMKELGVCVRVCVCVSARRGRQLRAACSLRR